MAESSGSVKMIFRVLLLIVLAAAIVVAFQAASWLGGPSTDAQAAREYSPRLIAAVIDNDTEAIAREIAAGADPDALTPVDHEQFPGMPPIVIAARKGHADAVVALAEADANVNARSEAGRTPLVSAARWGNLETVAALIQAGAALDARSDNGMTALMFAAARGEPATVQALVDAGCRVDERNKWGQTALMAAARTGSIEKIAILLEAGARPDDTDAYGDTALIIAATNDVPAGALAALIQAGADVNHPGNDGVTALMRAASRGALEHVGLLIANGADCGMTDTANNWTARDWAAIRDDDKGAQVIAAIDACMNN